MTKLLAAMDVSGSPSKGNYLFLAIVICTEEHLCSLKKRLKSHNISLSLRKGTSTRSDIASQLQFTTDDCLVICCKIERDRIINKIKKDKRKLKQYSSIDAIYYTFNSFLYSLLRDKIINFLASHNCDQYDVHFECDSDCVDFTKDVGLQHISEGEVHVIADVIAWLNNHQLELDGIILPDVIKKLEKFMYRAVNTPTS